MKKNQALIESIFQSSPIGMALVSVEGNLIKANECLCLFLDIQEEELLKRNFKNFSAPEEAEKKLLGSLLKGESDCYRVEKQFLKSNGERGWAQVGVSVFEKTDEDPILLYQIAETAKIASQEGVAHDLNNLLVIINLNASTIETLAKNPEVEKEEIVPFADKIKQTVIRINDFIGNFRS